MVKKALEVVQLKQNHISHLAVERTQWSRIAVGDV